MEIELGKKQYELAMRLIGLVILTEYKEKTNSKDDFDRPLGEYSQEYTRVLSPIIMNIIRDINRVWRKIYL